MTLRIALRYLYSRKSHKVVNVISLISLAGVAVATMAIVVVLSVFNGFSDLAARQLSALDPDVEVSPVAGKVLHADSVLATLAGSGTVAAIAPVLTERALLVAADGTQTSVVVKGVDDQTYSDVVDPDPVVIDGAFVAPGEMEPGLPAPVLLSVGVAMSTGLRPSPESGATLYMPRRVGRLNPANPAAAYRSLPVMVTGVFAINQPEYDGEYIFAPLSEVRRLLEYDADEASAVEIRLGPGATAEDIAAILGQDYKVLSRQQQHADSYRMIAVEKWITFLMLVFILLIASFNIVSTLSLMVIEKQHDMATLRALGASHHNISSIFVAEGWLITAAGGLVGCLAGMVLVLVQQHFGIIRLGGDPTALTIDTYPVRLAASDVAMVLATVAVTGLAISQISRLFTRKIR